MPPLAFTVSEVADKRLLPMSRRTIYRLIKDGHLQTVNHMGRLVISVAELERFVNEKAGAA